MVDQTEKVCKLEIDWGGIDRHLAVVAVEMKEDFGLAEWNVNMQLVGYFDYMVVDSFCFNS